ncbi:MAG: MFS transporter [Nocardioides sp.]
MNLREVPRVVWVLASARFVGSLSSYVMLFLTLYLTGPRGLATAPAGLLAGAYGVGWLLGNFTGGRWGDRFGHRRVLLTASTVSSLLLVAVPWLPLTVLAVALPVSAYLAATGGVSAGALSALAVSRGDRRTSVAVGRAASNAGFVVGPLIGAALVAVSYDLVFVVEGGAGLALRLVLSRTLPRDAPDVGAPGAERHGLWRAVRADRALVVLLPGIVLVDIVYRQLYTTVPLHLRDARQPLLLYTVLIAVGSGLILLLEIPVAQRLRSHPPYVIIASGYALVGLGMLLFGLPVTATSAVAAMVVVTAGEILYKTTATAHVLDAAPDHLVGQYQGLYSGASTSGSMLAAPIGTAIYAAAPGLLWPLCCAAGVGAAGLVLASYRVSRRSPAATPRESPGTAPRPRAD